MTSEGNIVDNASNLETMQVHESDDGDAVNQKVSPTNVSPKSPSDDVPPVQYLETEGVSTTLAMTPPDSIFDKVIAEWGCLEDTDDHEQSLRHFCEKVDKNDSEQLLQHIRSPSG